MAAREVTQEDLEALNATFIDGVQFGFLRILRKKSREPIFAELVSEASVVSF